MNTQVYIDVDMTSCTSSQNFTPYLLWNGVSLNSDIVLLLIASSNEALKGLL